MSRRGAGAIITAGLLLAGCTPGTTSATTNRSANPAPRDLHPAHAATAASSVSAKGSPAVDDTDPGAVALAAATALLEYDTRSDNTPADTTARAAALLTPDLGAALETPVRTDSSWLDLELHNGYTTAVVTRADEYGQPADTATTAYVQVSAVVTFTGRDGWTRTQPPRVMRLTLVATAGGWRVDGLSE